MSKVIADINMLRLLMKVWVLDQSKGSLIVSKHLYTAWILPYELCISRSLNTCAIHWPCFAQADRAMYSDSQLDVATDLCLLLDHEIGLPWNIATLPETLFLVLLSLAQSAAEYITKCLCAPPGPYHNFWLAVEVKYRITHFNACP